MLFVFTSEPGPGLRGKSIGFVFIRVEVMDNQVVADDSNIVMNIKKDCLLLSHVHALKPATISASPTRVTTERKTN